MGGWGRREEGGKGEGRKDGVERGEMSWGGEARRKKRRGEEEVMRVGRRKWVKIGLGARKERREERSGEEEEWEETMVERREKGEEGRRKVLKRNKVRGKGDRKEGKS